jgi:beta-lactamase class A
MTGFAKSLTAIVLGLSLAVLSLAVPAARSTWPSLFDGADRQLQSRLEAVVEAQGLQRKVKDGRLALALVDITRLDAPHVASVNGHRMMYAASLPKIAILLGAFVEAERGALKLDAGTRRDLTDMIRVSSNEAATRMLRRVGGNRLQEILASRRFRLYDPTWNGGLWVGKEYGPSQAFQRDPLHNLSHGATALQTARFYYMLETGQLVNPKLSGEMKKCLSEPGIRHKFVAGLADRPGARIFRKSGSWRHWHADSALVEFGRYRYIMVGLAEDPNGGKWLERLAAPLHDLVVPVRVAQRGERP